MASGGLCVHERDGRNKHVSSPQEAITEVPELGSPMPEYEIYNDDDDMDEDDDSDEKRRAVITLPLPPEKGILIGPSCR